MKKIYLFSVALMAFVSSSMGQSSICTTDPNAQPKVTNYQIFRENGTYYCVISLMNFPANGEVILRGTGDVAIPANSGGPITTNAAGEASFTYDCNANLALNVEVCRNGVPGLPSGCCRRPVPQPAALPMKLTAFTGRLQTDNSVVLDWTSVVEFNSFKYEVQRSVDGKYFETVGSLNAAGSSETSIKYTFDDQLPANGAYFYRLKQIDFDGKFEYSKVVYVNSKKGAGVITKIFPNPTKGEIQLIGATSADLTTNNLHIYSIAGQRIPYRITGANAITIDPSTPDGIYIMKFKDQRFKLVKGQSSGAY